MALSHPILFPQNHPHPSSSSSSSVRRRILLPISAASSAASPGGAAEPMPKPRRTVAGVDQDSLLDPVSLADPDSLFFNFRGIKLHHKLAHHEPESTTEIRVGLPMILLHGFGASLFSWNRVMRPLARLVSSKVLAFDRPAFGLTERASSVNNAALNPYSMVFSVIATLAFIEMLGAQRAILVGHSAGCLVAVNAYFEAPERVAALILVAPAIFAPVWKEKLDKEMDAGEGGRSNVTGEENPIVRIWRWVCGLFGYVAGAVFRIWTWMRDLVGLIYVKAVSALLRSALAVILVRFVMDKFGIAGVRSAWYDASKIPHHVIQGYTKPLRAKGWEKALLEHTLAMFIDSGSKSKSKPPLVRRLSAITCPVLIVTGDSDRIVPAWNAVRLSKAIPGSTLEIIKNCGHLPHEERAEEFLSVIDRFLQRVFRAEESQFSAAAA